MSRTYKDAPYIVRRVRYNGRKFHREFKEFDWKAHPRYRGQEPLEEWRAEYDKWRERRDEFEREYFTDNLSWFMVVGNGPPKWFRQSLNQQYRAKTNQMIRQGKEDILPLPKKNANWLWW